MIIEEAQSIKLLVAIFLRQEQKVVDFDRLNDYKHDFQDLDTGFCCIGTSKAKSGGKVCMAYFFFISY